MLTVSPWSFIERAAAITCSTVVPGTKRDDIRWPTADRSASARIERLSDNQMKNALSMRAAGEGVA
ncbi:MAG TPA: hypothetical protein VGQ71_04510 [Terriglobales bacterium]|nr:hypothetical protein [Terriglobales bacterium]